MLQIGDVREWSPEIVTVVRRTVETGQGKDDGSRSKGPAKISVALVTKNNQCNWHVCIVWTAIVSSSRLAGISSVDFPIMFLGCMTFIHLSSMNVNSGIKIVRMHEGVICQERQYHCFDVKHRDNCFGSISKCHRNVLWLHSGGFEHFLNEGDE